MQIYVCVQNFKKIVLEEVSKNSFIYTRLYQDSFNSNSLGFCDKISKLGSWNDHIISVAKAAASKFGFLFRTRRIFTPTQLLTLYKAQIRPCLEYGSHLWRGISKHSLVTLDAIRRPAIRLIGDPEIISSLDSLVHLRADSALYLFYIDITMAFVLTR